MSNRKKALGRLAVAVCERDYLLLEEHHPTLFSALKEAVDEGNTDAEILALLRRHLTEEVLAQRMKNALIYMRGANV